ncbi:hypothetical protein PMAYCL1PPCAC_00492, partial [Pristionchus mayeri]
MIRRCALRKISWTIKWVMPSPQWIKFFPVSRSRVEFARSLVSILSADAMLGRFMMETLENQIGTAKACCFQCKLIFANAAEYFTHLLTFFHL